MDGRMDGERGMNGWMDEQKQTDGRMMDGWIDGDRWMDGWMETDG